MSKLKKENLRFEKEKKIERSNDCPYYGNKDDTPLGYCVINPCYPKQAQFCEAKSIEKLNVITGKTKELDKFEL